MENKELKIIPPEGYEIDKENSTLDCIKFIKKRNTTYEDVIEALFSNKRSYFLNNYGEIIENIDRFYFDANSSTSKKQVKKLFAINKLMNIAKYLNEDWKPLWNIPKDCKYFIYIEQNGLLKIDFDVNHVRNYVYFKTKELAKQAIDILGEDTIRLALSTDY